MMIRYVVLPTITAAALVIASCSGKPDPIAGGQDFPNSMAAMGKLAIEMIGRQNDWQALGNAPTGLESLAQYNRQSAKKRRALARRAKKTIASDTTRDFRDTASGVVTEYRFHDDFVITLHDTLTLVYDSTMRDSIDGNETVISLSGRTHWKLLAMTHRYAFTNIDTSGEFDHRFSALAFDEGADATSLEIATIETPGPSGSFDSTADNCMKEIYMLTLKDSDTLLFMRGADADGDGVVWPDTVRPSSVFDYTRIAKQDSVAPDIVREWMDVRLEYFPAAPGRSIPYRYAQHTVYEDGREEWLRAGSTRADSVLAPGDAAWITATSFWPEPDTLSRMESHITLRIGEQPIAIISGNTLLSFAATAHLRKGPIAGAKLSFHVTNGQTDAGLTAGSFFMEADLRPSGAATLEGEFDSSITGEYTAPDGARYRGFWDAEGRLVIAEIVGGRGSVMN